MGLIIVLLFSLLTARRYAAEINLFAYKKRPDRGVSVCRTLGSLRNTVHLDIPIKNGYNP